MRKRAATSRVRRLPAALMLLALAADLGAVVLIAAMANAGNGPPLDVFTVGGIVTGAAYAVVGWLIASRRSDNSIGWVFLVVALSQAGGVFASAYSLYGLSVAPGSLPVADLLSWVAVWAWAPGFTLLVTLSVLLFPDGRPPSARWLPVVWATFVVMGLLLVPVAVVSWPHRGPDLLGGTASMTGGGFEIALGLQTLGIVLVLPLAAASIAGMVVRYRGGGPIERQQLKWFTYAAVPDIASIVSTGFVTFPPLLAFLVPFVMAPLLPAAAAVAILRYRLYEIDRLVSRTIAYGLLTGMLVLTYAGLILLLQGPLGTFTNGDTLTVALSTLAVAALFTPVRRRVQRVVDRRFDRARYDAERTTGAFSERLRDEVDLATVTADLDGTVRQAMAPSEIGVWLRGADQ